MAVPRPKRSSRRYKGEEAVGTEGVANLSSLKKQRAADGSKLRMRYAAAFAGTITIICVIATALSGKKDIAVANTGVSLDDYLTMPTTPTAPSDAFEILSHQSLDDLKSSVALYKHKKSGMKIVTMIPADPYQDATFGINFRTPSEKDDGAQAVVYKAILAGSVNYPIKDPFNQLKRGSLQTYSDTWAERDRTTFVVSSHNLADFRNNLKVTIDAVFHPLFIDEEYKWIYRQEGWRLETPDNKHLILNGNTYIDAKAAQMDPEEVMIKHIYKNLFADHVYSKNPTGEAAEVVTMTYQELIAYYKEHYHPSNGQGFCYGKQSFIDTCLDELHNVLQQYEDDPSIRKRSEVEWKDLTDLDKEIKNIGYPDFQEKVDYRAVIAWVLNEQPMDLRTEVAWHLIYELLAGSTTAPIAKVIYDMNLGTDVVTHFQHSLQQWVMALGVTGIASEEDVQRANDRIMKVLENIVSDGFDRNAMQAALHKIDFQFREQSSGSMPRGAQYFSDILSHWNYDRDPMLPLQASNEFVKLKTEIEENGQGFILELLTKKMFDSKHTTSLDLHPDMNFALEYEKLEKEWLSSVDQFISNEEGMKFMKETAELFKVQETSDTEEALMTIPRLEVSQLNGTQYTPTTQVIDDIFESGITTMTHQLPFTNGIAYVDLAFDISQMEFDDVVLIPLFCQLLLEGGTEHYDDVEIQQQIDKYSGGISITPLIEEIVETDSEGYYVVPDGKHFVTKLVISGSCIAADTCLPMLNLFRHFVWDSDVRNKEKAIDILEARINEMEEDIQTNGHKYTTSRVESRYSLSGFVREQWYGVTQLMQMRRALAQIKDNFTNLSLRLVKMQDALKRGHRSGMLMSVTGDEEALADVKGPLRTFLQSTMPLATQRDPFQNFKEHEHPWVPVGMHRVEEEFAAETKNQAFTVPTRVNHVAKGGVLYDVGERIPGSDMVVTQFLGGHYLYNELRFNKGAQEAWALLDMDSGVCIYQSDRDPNIFATLDIYERGATWLWEQVHNGELSVEAKSAIVGAIGKMDAKIMTEPNRLGYDSIVSRLKQDLPEYRQRWRDQILGSTAKDFMAMVERLGSWGHPSVSIVTSPEIFDTIDQEDFSISKCDYSGYIC